MKIKNLVMNHKSQPFKSNPEENSSVLNPVQTIKQFEICQKGRSILRKGQFLTEPKNN